MAHTLRKHGLLDGSRVGIHPVLAGAGGLDDMLFHLPSRLSLVGKNDLVPDDDAAWDERYASTERVWSGQANHALVTEVADLTPGRALDVGCGEGADAVWLAAQGWRVTALDVSRVALERAALHARDAAVDVEWIHAGLVAARLPHDAFDLVSVHYPALLRTPTRNAERSLLATVAAGGVLLVVHHADVDTDTDHAHASTFDPADYVSHADVVDFLGEDWQVEVDETRPRNVTSGAGAHHTHDEVLRARRLR